MNNKELDYIWDKYNNQIKAFNERTLHELINEGVICDIGNPKIGEWIEIISDFPLECEILFLEMPHEITNDNPMITRELLMANGFKLKVVPGSDGWEDFDEYKLEDYSQWPEEDPNFKYERNFIITFKHNISNTKNRDWGLHIDNKVCESVAYVDVSTVEHANKLFEIMDIDFRLEIK